MTESKALAGINEQALEFLSQRDANRGMDVEEVGNSPVLSLNQSGGDGKQEGWFAYKPTGKQFFDPIVSITYVKQCKLDTEYAGTITKDKPHYLVAGVIEETDEPFIMYIKGISYNKIWELMDETRHFRKHPTSPIPLYAFRIKLTSHKEKTKFGEKYAVEYEVLTQESGIPIIEENLNRLKMLDLAVDSSERMIEGIISYNKQGGYDDEEDYQSHTTVAGEHEIDDLEGE